MVIRNGLSWFIVALFRIIILTVAVFFLLLQPAFANRAPLICVWLFLVLFFLWYDFEQLRRIEMDEKGCTVSVGFYKRFYSWDDMKTMYIKDYPAAPSQRNGIAPKYKRYLFFSANAHIDEPRLGPNLYAKLLHPLSSFCVHFSEENDHGIAKLFPLNEVKEAELKKKLIEWGVKVEGFTE